MFRKMSSIMALAMVLASVACNTSVVGPSGTKNDSSNDPVRPPAVYDKVCIEDMGVQILSPYESQVVHVGQLVVVQWATRHICGQGNVAEASVSYDDGATWFVIGAGKNLVSAAWRVTSAGIGTTPRIQVTVDNTHGFISSAEVQLTSAITAAPDDGPRDPSEHD